MPRCVLDCFHHGASTRMTETLVKPKNLTDLVRSDAFTTLASQTLVIRRSDIRDDAIETLLEDLESEETYRGVHGC